MTSPLTILADDEEMFRLSSVRQYARERRLEKAAQPARHQPPVIRAALRLMLRAMSESRMATVMERLLGQW